MKKEENKQLVAIPTGELLSELESMVVFGGIGMGVDVTNECTNSGCSTNNVANCGTKCTESCNPKFNSGCISKPLLTCTSTEPKYRTPCT
ncbi:MAG: hypothetical protein K2G24_01315 [Muribaculaceae bacterium]|nr:hypothetical protein [Muribaculaceae bacterium]